MSVEPNNATALVAVSSGIDPGNSDRSLGQTAMVAARNDHGPGSQR